MEFFENHENDSGVDHNVNDESETPRINHTNLEWKLGDIPIKQTSTEELPLEVKNGICQLYCGCWMCA